MFLTWFSPEAVAASMPAGILNFTLTSLFIGTASYIGTFVAQYYGANENKMIGKTLFQGIIIALIGAFIIFFFGFSSDSFFSMIGHPPKIMKLESIYFKILCFGSAGPIISSVLSGFYSGRGKNWPVMWINFTAAGVNIVLDWILIFGNLGFPKMGMKGAAIATIIAGFSPVIIYLLLILKPSNNKEYGILPGLVFDKSLFLRILKFGVPSGIHFFIDVAGFTAFLLIVGRLGITELASTNIALNINSIAFMPMIGCGIAISMLVGQNIGRGNIKVATRTVWSGFQICFLYMSIIATMYVIVPDLFILPFSSKADPVQFAPIYKLTRTLLIFVAIYSIFDTLNIVFASAIKGAGDTKFVMVMCLFLSSFLLVIPTFIAIVIFNLGLYVAWLIASIYISLMGFAFLTRFLTGKWKTMSVISTSSIMPSNYPDVPINDL